jgi:hypothetical protein
MASTIDGRRLLQAMVEALYQSPATVNLLVGMGVLERVDMDQQELARRFEYHPPSTPEVASAHEQVRASLLSVAGFLNRLLPDGREKAMAMTALDDACMYANACVARTQLLGSNDSMPHPSAGQTG